jgi:hypothetical protein
MCLNSVSSANPIGASINISRNFAYGNLEPQKDRLKRDEVLRVRNQAKKIILEEDGEIQTARDQGMLTV